MATREERREVEKMLRDRLARMPKPACDQDGPGLAAAEMRMTARRLHEMADQAEAGRNDVRVDVPGFHALAYYMESWSLSIDPTCKDMADVNPVDGFVCSACDWWGVAQQACDNGWGEPDFDSPAEYAIRFCPNCGARVVRADD